MSWDDHGYGGMSGGIGIHSRHCTCEKCVIRPTQATPARQAGWLQDVVANASKRVEEWPEWKKDIELAATPAPGAERLRERITEYLAHGGLFNPESVEHAKVRELLIEVREALAAAPPAPSYVQDFNAQWGRGIFVVTGEHQRTAFLDREAAEKYLANQNPERFKIVEYPKPAAAPGSHPTHPNPGYDAAFYEWFKRSPYYAGHWTQESMDYAEGAYLAAGDRHASAERLRQLELTLKNLTLHMGAQLNIIIERSNRQRGSARNRTRRYAGTVEEWLRMAREALPPSTGEKSQ